MESHSCLSNFYQVIKFRYMCIYADILTIYTMLSTILLWCNFNSTADISTLYADIRTVHAVFSTLYVQ